MRPYSTGPRQEDIATALQGGPLTTQEIAARLGIVDSTKMHQPLYQLEREGRVVRQGHTMMARAPDARPGKRIVWALTQEPLADLPGATEQSSKSGCEDCDRPYGDQHGFPDLVISFDAWRQISRHGDDSGLLCPSCICKRLYDKGIRTTGAFMSGPIISVDEHTNQALRQLENIELALEGRMNRWGSALAERIAEQGSGSATPGAAEVSEAGER